jgi:hypothetical protein
MYPEKKEYSRWHHNSKKEVISATRIDHTIVSEHLLGSLVEVRYFPVGFSDHSVLLVYINEQLESIGTSNGGESGNIREGSDERSEELLVGPGVWKLYHGAFTERQFCLRTQEFARQLVSSASFPCAFSPESWTRLKERLRNHAKNVSVMTGYKRKQPGKKMAEIQQRLDRLDITKTDDRSQIPDLLRDLRKYQAILVLDDSRRYGSRLPKHLCQPGKKFVPKHNFIMELRSDVSGGIIHKGRAGKEQAAMDFYRALFSIITPFEEAEAKSLLNMIPPSHLLKPEETELLRQPLTELELSKALATCGTGSAPGMDGLPFEYWKNVFNTTVKPFTEMCSQLTAAGQIQGDGWPVLLGSLLHKKGDKAALGNYRLLSILDSDLRWRSKALLDKLMPLCQNFLSEEQTAFIKGWNIVDNVMAVMLAVEETRMEIKTSGKEKVTLEKEGVILALDQEKAYDRVRWDWLFGVLSYIGVPDEMVSSIRISYRNPVVRISINKHITPALRLECGVLQGDPLSVLLYILTIQPLLYALKQRGIGIPITWEGRTAMLSARAHADDLVVFMRNEQQYQELMAVLELYCKVSNAIMHPGKAAVLMPGKPAALSGWYQNIQIKRVTDDYNHLGCPLRPDGESPEKALQSLLASVKSSVYFWNVAERPLLDRIEVTNTFILSKVWHATQLCPIYPEFFPHLQRIITGFIFGRTNAPIMFEFICYPRRLGGLGLLNPTHMATAMNGRVVARMMADCGELGTAFKLQMLYTIQQAGGSFFRLLAKGKFAGGSPRMPVRGPPFWVRVYNTLIDLDLAVRIDWDKYSDEEFLALPYDTPDITGKHTDLLGKRVRSALHPIRLSLLRDILVFRQGHVEKFQIRNKEEGEAMIQHRMIQLDPSLAENRAYHFRSGQDSGKYGAARKAMVDLRRYWVEYIWKDAPAEFKERLRRIQTPPPSLSLMRPGATDGFPGTSEYDLIPWDNLTLAKAPCHKYTVRKGREWVGKAKLLQPDWEEIRLIVKDDANVEKRMEQIWKGAWNLLNWKYRLSKHYEVYWRLLHKRPQKVVNLGVEGKNDYSTGTCYNCDQPDDCRHAYLNCPAVQTIWRDATDMLRRLLGGRSFQIDYTIPEIVLAFPELRRTLPKALRMRVILWHSTVIYTIATLRGKSIGTCVRGDNGVQFNFDGWEQVAKTQIREMLWEIHEGNRNDTRGKYYPEWVEDNAFITVSADKLLFLE